MALSVAVALFGIWLATRWYKRETPTPSRLAGALPVPYKVLLNKYFVDEIYFGAFIRPFVKLCDMFAWVDKWIVDGVGVNGPAILMRALSYPVRLVQWGLVQWYALVMIAGLVGFVFYYVVKW